MTIRSSWDRPPAGIDKSVVNWDRLAILFQLFKRNEGASYQTLRFYSGMAPGSLSNHLLRLEEAGLICVEKSFVDRKPETRAIITEEGRRFLGDFASRMEEFREPREG